MSTLALRNYGLVLPKNYVSIDSTEMEYIDGGWKFYTSSRDCADISADLGMLAAGVGTAGGIASVIAGVIGTVAAIVVPIVGCVASGYLNQIGNCFKKATREVGLL